MSLCSKILFYDTVKITCLALLLVTLSVSLISYDICALSDRSALADIRKNCSLRTFILS